jgi:hypothetical protein
MTLALARGVSRSRALRWLLVSTSSLVVLALGLGPSPPALGALSGVRVDSGQLSPGVRERAVVLPAAAPAGSPAPDGASPPVAGTPAYLREAEDPAGPTFTIEKEQKLEGEASYTKGKLTGKAGETVDYKIIVKNIANMELSFKPLSDSKCENMTPSDMFTLAVGGSETFTCEHKGLAAGIYANVASITEYMAGNEYYYAEGRNSNQVEVEVPVERGFTIELQQNLEGEASYTKSKLTGKAGETVDYKVNVKNTGNTVLSLGALSDYECERIDPSGMSTLPVGASETFTCEHKDLAAGIYANVASITDYYGPYYAEGRESNEVEVEVRVEPTVCPISEASIRLHGVEGDHYKRFRASISSTGIRKITFYIDRKKYRTLKSSQAKNGRFMVTIDPTKYSYGLHRVSVKSVMRDSSCANIARASDFLRPKPKKRVARRICGSCASNADPSASSRRATR